MDNPNIPITSSTFNNYLSSGHSGRFGNSSFWMDDLESARTAFPRKEFNILKMARYQRAISNFVKIITRKELPVEFCIKGRSYTNGQSVTLAGNITDSNFDSTAGLALHEASHIAHTDFDWSNKFFGTRLGGDYLKAMIAELGIEKQVPTMFKMAKNTRDTFKINRELIKDLTNWIEDRRIDNIIFKTSPGYKAYYHALYDHYFLNTKISVLLESSEFRDESVRSYMVRIVNFMNKSTDLTALAGLRKIAKIIDLPNISRLTSVVDSAMIAILVADVITECVVNLKPKQKEKPKLDSSKSSTGKPKDSNKKDSSESSSESKPEKNTDESESGTSDDAQEYDSEEETSSEGTSGGSSEDESDEDVSESKPSVNKPEDSEIKEPTAQDIDDDGSTAQGEIIEDTTPDLDIKTPGNGDLSASDLMKANAVLDSIDALIAGEVKKSGLKQSEARVLNEISGNSSINIDSVQYDGRPVNVIQVKVTPTMLNSIGDSIVAYCFHTDGSSRDYNTKSIITPGLLLGTQLGKKLKVRDTVRDTKYSRLQSGKIDRRLLHQCGYDVANIFQQIHNDKFTPSVVDISIDASSSMSGKKWVKTQVMVLAIAKACSMIQNIQVKISYRYDIQMVSNEVVLVDVYDSKRDTIKHLTNCMAIQCPENTTVDSLVTAYQLKKNMITKGSSDVKSYFINISDGAPSCYLNGVSYSGDSAHRHIRKCREEIERLGVTVLSYFVSEHTPREETIKQFKSDWGTRNAAFIELNEVVPLAKSLNEMFLTK